MIKIAQLLVTSGSEGLAEGVGKMRLSPAPELSRYLTIRIFRQRGTSVGRVCHGVCKG